jgi:ABC-2 type transport system ATP-binding protein
MAERDGPTSLASPPGPKGIETNERSGPAVRAEELVKHYDGREGTVEAVRGVNLEIHPGEIFGFLGPNGAGKSTTVRMLTTLLTITSGHAEVAGVDVTGEPDEARRRIGVALQEAGLDPRQTGRELLILHAQLFGLGAAQAQDRAATAGAGGARGRRRPGD